MNSVCINLLIGYIIKSIQNAVSLFILILVPITQSWAEDLTEMQQQVFQLKEELRLQQQKLDILTAKLDLNQVHPEGLQQLSGFFDVTAHTTDTTEHPMDLGSLEVDIEYDTAQNVSISTALVWDGDVAEVAIALLDYHVSSHSVPPRGSLYTEEGYHIQFGRFDVPFALDYEFFAAPDRINITAPMTTSYILSEGLNGDGIRIYGSSTHFNYTAYMTNSLFEENGISFGTRIGLSPWGSASDGQVDAGRLNVGLSVLQDRDSDEELRKTLRAIDLSWHYDIAAVVAEYIILDRVDTSQLTTSASQHSEDEYGYNIRLSVELEPMTLFIGYGEWKPDYSVVPDQDDPTVFYAVDKLHRVTIAGNYVFDDHLQVKLEYYHHMGDEVELPGFEKSRLTFQMVALF